MIQDDKIINKPLKLTKIEVSLEELVNCLSTEESISSWTGKGQEWKESKKRFSHTESIAESLKKIESHLGNISMFLEDGVGKYLGHR